MKLLKRFARTLLHLQVRCRRDFSRLLVASLTGGDRSAGAPAAIAIVYRMLCCVYLSKRLVQDLCRGRAPRNRAAFVFWLAEMQTALLSKLYLWSTRPLAGPVDRYETQAQNNRLFPAEAAQMRRLAQQFAYRPLISILVPVFDAAPEWLERLVRSVLAQTYDRWELILVDDGSTSAATRAALELLADRDERIVVELLATNGGVSAATNRAAELAHGEFLAFLDHDDELYPDALWYVVERLVRRPECDLVYTDEELVFGAGGASHPVLKPGFSPELLTAYNYICHLLVLRKALFDELGGLRSRTNGAQDYDLVLRAIERTDRVAHVPRVLYRWHVGNPSLSRRRDAAGRMHVARAIGPITCQVVQEHLDRQGIPALARPFGDWVRPEFRTVDRGKVSIIICTRDHPWLLWRAVRSIERRTDYPNYEILIVDNGSSSRLGRLCLRWLGRRHRVLRIPSGPEGFNFSRLNNQAAKEASGRFLLFLNDDTRVLTRGWLSALVGYADRPGVGAAGAWLRRPDGRNQHSGVILGAMGWGPWHAFMDLPARHHLAHRQYLMVPRNWIAVTGACLLTHRAWFLRLGGFDEDHFGVSFNDVDYCLRLREQGARIACVPQAELVHYEGRSRGKLANPTELAHFRSRANGIVDPYWNPGFSRQYDGFVVETRRRSRGLLLQRPPHVLVVAPPHTNDDAPHPPSLFTELARRRLCTFELRADDSTDARREEMPDCRRYDVVFAQGPHATPIVEEAHRAGVASIWSLPHQWYDLPKRSTAEAAGFLRFLRALELPYQVVFNNPHTMGWAQVGVPRGNFLTLEAVPLEDPAQRPDADAIRRQIRRQWAIDDDVTLILAQVHFGPGDGVETILCAFRRLRRSGRSVRLLLLGHGSLSARRHDQLCRSIARLGGAASVVIDPSQDLDYFAAADVYVAHAVTDLRPKGVLSALALALPVVGSELLGNSQILYFGATGPKFRPFDAQSLMKALTAALGSPAQMGRAGRHWLDSRTHPETLLSDWGELVCEAAELTRGLAESRCEASATGRPDPTGTTRVRTASLRYVSTRPGGTIA